MEADARRERFDDMQLAFASVMASSENGELKQMLASHHDSLFQAGGWKFQSPAKSTSRAQRPALLRSQVLERMQKGEAI